MQSQLVDLYHCADAYSLTFLGMHVEVPAVLLAVIAIYALCAEIRERRRVS